MIAEKLPPAQRPEVVDPHDAPVIFVDWIVTGGIFENVVNVTLGAADHSIKRTQR